MRVCSVLIVLLLNGILYSQQEDGIAIKYTLLDNSEVVEYNKINVFASFPLFTVAGKESFSVGGGYQNTGFNFEDNDVPFETNQIERFHTFSLAMRYNRAFKNWGYTVWLQPQVSSNFDTSELSEYDLFFNASLVFNRYSEDKKSMWSVGVIQDHQNGLHFPIPIIAYTKRLNDNWSFKLGAPDSRVKWSFAENHSLEGFATVQGFMGNINDEIDIHKEDYLGSLRRIQAIIGAGYNVSVWDDFELTAKGGYSVFEYLKIKDLDNNAVYDFDMPSSLFVNVGIRYKLSSSRINKSPY